MPGHLIRPATPVVLGVRWRSLPWKGSIDFLADELLKVRIFKGNHREAHDRSGLTRGSGDAESLLFRVRHPGWRSEEPRRIVTSIYG
jgi:hypothetical protein